MKPFKFIRRTDNLCKDCIKQDTLVHEKFLSTEEYDWMVKEYSDTPLKEFIWH